MTATLREVLRGGGGYVKYWGRVPYVGCMVSSYCVFIIVSLDGLPLMI